MPSQAEPITLRRAGLRGIWDGATGYQRLAYLVGLALVATGLVHAAIWAVVGGSAAGPLSWRKPTTFGISFGMTTITLGWVATYLPRWRVAGWIASSLLCASTAAEVAWVSVQHARGVPSHFNTATPLDERLFQLGGAAIAVTVAVTAAMTLAAFTATTAAPPMALAIRAGLVGLLAAQAIGVWMIVHGIALLDAGADSLTQSMTTYGAAGVMKSAHAIPMHAIQVLAGVAWLLSRSGLPQRRQSLLVALATVGYSMVFGVALLRTVDGVGPVDARSLSMLAYLVAVGLLAAPLAAAAPGLRRHRTAG